MSLRIGIVTVPGAPDFLDYAIEAERLGATSDARLDGLGQLMDLISEVNAGESNPQSAHQGGSP